MSNGFHVAAGSASLVVGDAVVASWNAGDARWEVQRANATSLSLMPTALGIVKSLGAGPPPMAEILLSGELADNGITGLKPGKGDVVAVDLNAAIGATNLVRVERPNGCEFVVGTADANGNLLLQPMAFRGTSQQRVYDVCAYGAVADFDPNLPLEKVTPNWKAFDAAMKAMAADGNRAAKLVADGHFYIEQTLDVRQTLILEGTARSEPSVGGTRSSPGTWLVFPRDSDGIRLYSSPDGLEGGADYSVLRNLTISCLEERPPYPWPPPPPEVAALPPLEGQIGNGIHANCVFLAENVTIENFGEHGILINAGAAPAEPGNALGFKIDGCVISFSGGDGLHVLGNGASLGLVSNCLFAANWGWGVWDESTVGNTYLACIGEGNQGLMPSSKPEKWGGRNHDYKTLSPGNASLFLGCHHEASTDELHAWSGAIGGLLGQGFGPGVGGFSFSADGTAHNSPLAYQPSTEGAFARTEMGALGDEWVAFHFETQGLAPQDRTWLRLTGVHADAWWSWQVGGRTADYAVIRFPTALTTTRHGHAPWVPNGLLLGDQARHDSASTPPSTFLGVGRTYEVGDVVWNSTPTRVLGWRCSRAGTANDLAALSGHNVTATVTAGANIIEVNDGSQIRAGHYITIDGNTYKVLSSDSDKAVEIKGGAVADAEDATVAYAPPIFQTISRTGGQATIVMPDANYRVSDEEASCEILKFTGQLGATRTVTFPAPASDDDAYQRTVRAAVAGGDLRLNIAVGLSPSVTVREGTIAIVGFDKTGPFLVTPPS